MIDGNPELPLLYGCEALVLNNQDAIETESLCGRDEFETIQNFQLPIDDYGEGSAIRPPFERISG